MPLLEKEWNPSQKWNESPLWGGWLLSSWLRAYIKSSLSLPTFFWWFGLCACKLEIKKLHFLPRRPTKCLLGWCLRRKERSEDLSFLRGYNSRTIPRVPIGPLIGIIMKKLDSLDS
ncbi:hypothetical protein CDAR_614291 [Caerostris darwini]|uniref:Uncharacterized protein n=1 Tax=Caerostris darwini TaxID=1538125 RepID=A0AAV4MCI4_9ARAC|nr:hypothetical protein CDAR_614291 [Caerostris darwini]